ncbi:MAG: VirB4-like conjugal transfer ATPase, CD1110 family [Oscillospiraceae bacterium]
MDNTAKSADKLRTAKEKPPKKVKEKPEKRKIARSVQDTIPYDHVCNNYIIQTSKNHFSKTYSFSDVTYTAAEAETQEQIFLAYGDLLNSFDTTDDIQLTLHNNVVNEREFKSRILLNHMNDGFDEYRDEYNEMLLDKMQQGQNGITTKKYLTITVTAADLQIAQQKFLAHELHIRSIFQKIGCDIVALKSNERIRIIADIFRGVNQEIRPISSSEFLRGAEKSLCCPDYFEFKRDYFLFNDKYARMIFLKHLPSGLTDNILTDICGTSLPIVVTINIAPVDPSDAIKIIKRQLTSMKAEKIQKEKKASQHGVYTDVINEDLKLSLAEAEEQLNDLQSKNQKMFLVNLVIMITGNSFEELENNTEKIEAVFRTKVCTTSRAAFQQEDAMASCLPLGNCRLPVRRTLTTESTAVFMPFNSKELSQEGGTYYGLNQSTNNLIVFNRASLINANGFILGCPGSGKSFSAKREMVNVFLASNDEIIIVDPEREYTNLVKALNGELIYISESSNSHLNPLEISIEEYNKGEDVVSGKFDFFLSFFQTIMGKVMITPEQKTIIDNCLHEVYQEFLLGHTDRMPTLRDYYEILKKQKSEEAKTLYMSLELYVNGSMKAFSFESNVNTNNRVVVYDIKDLGKQLKPLGMMVVLENLWDRIVQNRERGIRTRIYIDEIYLLFRNEESANFLYELYKRARKWGGIPTGITQNVEDLLKSDTARSMLSNSEFILMLNQAASDREQLARILKIPDTLMWFVTGAPAGSGLIYCGLNGTLPFKDDFPTDTKLYKLMTTKFGE